MILGIDAASIRSGGGITHLIELLRHAKAEEYGFDQVIVWGGKNILKRLEERSWLKKVYKPILDKSLIMRIYWQRFTLDYLITQSKCDLLFVPGGSYAGYFHPFITMSQNLLPFMKKEIRRYGISWMGLKLQFLRRVQAQTMKRAEGVIFLTDYARKVTMHHIKNIKGYITVIPHGINPVFNNHPKAQYAIEKYSINNPYRIIYVSIVTVYKHQWNVAKAVAALRKKGIPLHLELIGPAYPPALRKLKQILRRIDPEENFIHYSGPILHTSLHEKYHSADAFIFASTCETFGQIVTEAMLSGLPIACSNIGTTREILGNSAFYFDPEKPAEIAKVLKNMIENPTKREIFAKSAHKRAEIFTWNRCAHETFDFLAKVTQEFSG